MAFIIGLMVLIAMQSEMILAASNSDRFTRKQEQKAEARLGEQIKAESCAEAIVTMCDHHECITHTHRSCPSGNSRVGTTCSSEYKSEGITGSMQVTLDRVALKEAHSICNMHTQHVNRKGAQSESNSFDIRTRVGTPPTASHANAEAELSRLRSIHVAI